MGDHPMLMEMEISELFAILLIVVSVAALSIDRVHKNHKKKMIKRAFEEHFFKDPDGQ